MSTGFLDTNLDSATVSLVSIQFKRIKNILFRRLGVIYQEFVKINVILVVIWKKFILNMDSIL